MSKLMYLITSNLIECSQDTGSNILTLAFALEMLQPQIQEE